MVLSYSDIDGGGGVGTQFKLRFHDGSWELQRVRMHMTFPFHECSQTREYHQGQRSQVGAETAGRVA